MRYSEAVLARVFVVRLEDGDRLPETIEDFAREKKLLRGICLLIGGAAGGSRVVVGPEDGEAVPAVPMVLPLAGVHEVAGVGTIFPDESGQPVLHLHAAFGRGEATRTGCVRPGVDIWKVGEVVILELTGSASYREKDPTIGLPLLAP